jgi:Mn-dependent DtxR family transcriptional regulator
MHENPNEDDLDYDPGTAYDEAERNVLYLLTGLGDSQQLWSVPDLAREMDCPNVIDYVRGLRRAGLVNETTDGFVFATRAGVRMVQMVGHVV